MSRGTKASLEKRIEELTSWIVNPIADVSIDSLLDILCAVYDDCVACKSLKGSHVYTFVQRYELVVKKIKELRLTRKDFEELKLIARGFFGDVFLVRDVWNDAIYAMKVLKKNKMLKRQEITFFIEEKNVMAVAESDWIVKLHHSFQDEENLYLIMDYLPGGDLMSLLCKQTCFDEMTAKFYIAEVIKAIEEVHKMGYVHRDIKPDNLLLDTQGHVKLTDFGSCIQLGIDGVVRSDIPVGTPGYVSPEILRAVEGNATYGWECDFWSVGVVLYEMVVGQTPFDSENLSETNSKIMNYKEAVIFPDNIPLSNDIKDLIIRLIADKNVRLGKKGAEEVKKHPFFKDIDWNTLRKRTPPFVPELKGPTDTSNFEDVEDDDEFNATVSKRMNNLSASTVKPFSGDNLPFVGFSYTRKGLLGSIVQSGAKPPTIERRLSLAAIETGKDLTLTVEKIKSIQNEVDKWKLKYKEEEKRTEELEKLRDRLSDEYQSVKGALDSETIDKKQIEANTIHLRQSLSLLEVELQNMSRRYEQERQEKIRNEDRIRELEEELQTDLDSRSSLMNESSRELDIMRDKLENVIRDLERNLLEQKEVNKRQAEMNAEMSREKTRLLVELKDVNAKYINETKSKENSEAKLQELQTRFDEQLIEKSKLEHNKSHVDRGNSELLVQVEKITASLEKEKEAKQEHQVTVSKLTRSAALFELQMRDLEKKYSALLSEKNLIESRLSDMEKISGNQKQANVVVQELETWKSAKIEELEQSAREQEQIVRELMKGKASLEFDLKELKDSLAIEIEKKETVLEGIKNLQDKLDSEINKRQQYSDAFLELKAANLVLSNEIRILAGHLEEELEKSHATSKASATLQITNAMLENQVRDLNASIETLSVHKETIESKMKEVEDNYAREMKEKIALSETLKSLTQQKSVLTNELDSFRAKFSEHQAKASAQELIMRDLERQRSAQVVELEELRRSLNTEAKQRENADMKVKDTLSKLEKESTRRSELKTAFDSLEEEHDSLKSKAIELHDQLLIESTKADLLMEENESLKKKSELQQRKIDAVVSKFEGTLVNYGNSQKVISSPAASNDWQDRRASKMKTQEIKWLQQKYEHEVEKTKGLESQVLDLKLQKQQLERELDELKKSNVELHKEAGESNRNNQSVVGTGIKVLKSEFSTPTKSIMKESDDILKSVIRRVSGAKSAEPLSSRGINEIISVSDIAGSVVQLEGWVKIPKSKGIKYGWRKKFCSVYDYKLYLFEKQSAVLSEGFLISDLKGLLFFARAMSPKEMSYVATCIFVVQSKNLNSSNSTNGLLTGYAPEILFSKLIALKKRIEIEQKLRNGSENFLRVASGDQRTRVLKELEESRVRLENLHVLLHKYEYEYEISGRHANASIPITPSSPIQGSDSSSFLLDLPDDGHLVFNGHKFRVCDSNPQLACYQCHDKLVGSQKQILECAFCGFLCHRACHAGIFVSCGELQSLGTSNTVYIMVQDEYERARWLKTLDALRIAALADEALAERR